MKDFLLNNAVMNNLTSDDFETHYTANRIFWDQSIENDLIARNWAMNNLTSDDFDKVKMAQYILWKK